MDFGTVPHCTGSIIVMLADLCTVIPLIVVSVWLL